MVFLFHNQFPIHPFDLVVLLNDMGRVFERMSEVHHVCYSIVLSFFQHCFVLFLQFFVFCTCILKHLKLLLHDGLYLPIFSFLLFCKLFILFYLLLQTLDVFLFAIRFCCQIYYLVCFFNLLICLHIGLEKCLFCFFPLTQFILQKLIPVPLFFVPFQISKQLSFDFLLLFDHCVFTFYSFVKRFQLHFKLLIQLGIF